MISDAKHLDLTSPDTQRDIRAESRRYAVRAFFEILLLAGATAVFLMAVSQTMLWTYEDAVLKADAIEAQTANESMAWKQDEDAQDGRSPLYIDHLASQDRSWKPKESTENGLDGTATGSADDSDAEAEPIDEPSEDDGNTEDAEDASGDDSASDEELAKDEE